MSLLGDTESYDAVILDIGLPDMDCISIVERWCAGGCLMPVLILTARDRWSDKFADIDAGADDYVVKPFSYGKRWWRGSGRLSAGLPGMHASAELVHGPVLLDTKTSHVLVNGRYIRLTPHEYRFLSYLMPHHNEVISCGRLIEHLYAQDFDRDSNTIEVFVSRLRRKLGIDIIETIRGMGYRLQAP